MKKTPRLFVGQVLKRTLLGDGQIAAVIVKIVPGHYEDKVWILRVAMHKRKRLIKTVIFSECYSMGCIFDYFVPTGISFLENAP